MKKEESDIEQLIDEIFDNSDRNKKDFDWNEFNRKIEEILDRADEDD
ncbi:hypothetical protein QFZ31_005767 [Neobacillus niacini]|nr:hypothetical protein [Neobacillus niacini]MDQ0975889.1 hypothetical protein [Neobacillus niacini]